VKPFRRYAFAALPFILVAITTMEPGAQDAEKKEHAFIGSKKCKKCHLKQYKSWETTEMAKAFEVLKPGANADEKKAAGLDPNKDYTTDDTCLPCHVTGYGKEGGFVDIEKTPELAGVGCEMCHGAGGTYVQDQYMSSKNKKYKKADIVAVGMVDTVSEEQCRGCHNTDSPFVGEDYVFDFAKRKDEGTHEHLPLKYEH
jgi:hypothetical protein